MFRINNYVAVMLVLTSLICLVRAMDPTANPTDAQRAAFAICERNWNKCLKRCSEKYDPSSTRSQNCTNNCDIAFRACMKRIPDMPAPPPRRIGGLPTPTPRPGPSATAPPNKSNPTPTPRKGPGKIGTTGIGKASPTPSPKGPVLLEKSGKASPTPKPESGKKSHG